MITLDGEKRFKINDSFRITGRGLILIGVIKNGIINEGDVLEFSVDNIIYHRTILGVTTVNSKTESNVGLLIETDNENELLKLSEWQPKGVTGIVQ